MFLFLFTGLLLLIASTVSFPSGVYLLHGLPPLSSNGYDWGIFSPDSPANNDDDEGYIASDILYYTPNDHAGVNSVMSALQDLYPDVQVTGAASSDDIITVPLNLPLLLLKYHLELWLLKVFLVTK